MSNENRKPFLERPVAIVGLIASIIAIATGAVTLLGLFRDDDGTDDSPSAKIEACMRTHGLATALQREEIAADRILTRQCVWPPPVGAAPDGYTQIALAIGTGPGKSEAEGLTVANRFDTECQTIELSYLFNNMGTFTAVRPFRLSKGEIRRVEDGSVWRPRSDAETAVFTPRRDQSIVMSNSRYRFDAAQCI